MYMYTFISIYDFPGVLTDIEVQRRLGDRSVLDFYRRQKLGGVGVWFVAA
jgi:hypothetical protein